MLEPLSDPIVGILLQERLCTPRDLRRARSYVRRLAHDLPAFDSVWLDALAQMGRLSPLQVQILESSDPGLIRRGPALLESRVGQGPFSTTFLCRIDSGLDLVMDRPRGRHPTGQPAVVKEIGRDLLPSPDSVSRLTSLVAELSTLSHPAVAGPVLCFESESHLWLVSRRITGPTLSELLIRRGRFPVPIVLEIARQLLTGLAELEAYGLMHGDIRLSNVRLTSTGQAVLVDAGVRTAIDPEISVHSRLAPERYDGLAPELIGTAQLPTAASDLHALACLLWQLLAGRPPFPGGDPLGKLAAHQTRRIADIRDWAPDVPELFAETLKHWTEPDPGLRPERFSHALLALEQGLVPETFTPPPQQGTATAAHSGDRTGSVFRPSGDYKPRNIALLNPSGPRGLQQPGTVPSSPSSRSRAPLDRKSTLRLAHPASGRRLLRQFYLQFQTGIVRRHNSSASRWPVRMAIAALLLISALLTLSLAHHGARSQLLAIGQRVSEEWQAATQRLVSRPPGQSGSAQTSASQSTSPGMGASSTGLLTTTGSTATTGNPTGQNPSPTGHANPAPDPSTANSVATSRTQNNTDQTGTSGQPDPSRQPRRRDLTALPLPAPNPQGVIELTTPGPYLAGTISVVGPLSIRAAPGIQPQLIVVDEPCRLTAETVLLQGLHWTWHNDDLVSTAATDSSSSSAPRLPSLVQITAQTLNVTQCTFDQTGQSADLPRDANRLSDGSKPAPPAVSWRVTDTRDPQGARATFQQTVWYGNGTAVTCTSPLRELQFVHCLKTGTGSWLTLFSPPPSSQTHLAWTHSTGRGCGPLLRWKAPRPLPPVESIKLQLLDSVFDFASQSALIECFGPDPVFEAFLSVNLEGNGSVASRGIVSGAWIDSGTRSWTEVESELVAVEGLVTGQLEFVGPPGRQVGDAELVRAEGPRRPGQQPGIDPRQLPAFPVRSKSARK